MICSLLLFSLSINTGLGVVFPTGKMALYFNPGGYITVSTDRIGKTYPMTIIFDGWREHSIDTKSYSNTYAAGVGIRKSYGKLIIVPAIGLSMNTFRILHGQEAYAALYVRPMTELILARKDTRSLSIFLSMPVLVSKTWSAFFFATGISLNTTL